jgi:hypothetical protein
VLLNDPCSEGLVAVVNITSIYAGVYYDPTCVLQAGEHEFVDRPSYVLYEEAKIESARALSRGVNDLSFVPKPNISAKLFERICNGLLESEATPQKVFKYVSARFSEK